MNGPHTDQPDRTAPARATACVGCGGVVLCVLILLGVTVLRSDLAFFDDLARVEATLTEIVPCSIPRGYRPYRGAQAGAQRLVQIVPETYRGDEVPLNSSLLIAVWSFPPGTTSAQAERQAVDYWSGLVAQRLGAEAAADPADQPVVLPLRGGTVEALQRDLPGAGVPLRLIVAVAPRAPGGTDPVAFSFLGAGPRFDRGALVQFLESVQ